MKNEDTMKNEDGRWFGFMTLLMISTNIIMQLLIAFLQHRKKPIDFLREAAIIMLALKPAADAGRVASGQDKDKHHILSPKVEMWFIKAIELFAEAVPGCVLQVFALLKLGILDDGLEASAGYLASIFMSALTTGFISASISYVRERSERKERAAPSSPNAGFKEELAPGERERSEKGRAGSRWSCPFCPERERSKQERKCWLLVCA
jgi:hypothetical protein